MMRCRGLRFPGGGGLRRGWNGASLSLTDQGQEVGLKTCAIFGGVPQEDLNQSAFARAEMSLNTPARETVQERDRLLSQELFEFFGGHCIFVRREAMDAAGLVSIRV